MRRCMKRFCGNVSLILIKKPVSLIFSLTSAFTYNYSCSVNTMAEINNSWLLSKNTKRDVYSIKYRFKCTIFTLASIEVKIVRSVYFTTYSFITFLVTLLCKWYRHPEVSALSTIVFIWTYERELCIQITVYEVFH